MFTKIPSTLFFLTSLLFFVSCAEKDDPESETKKFTRIFDNNDFNASFTPVDLQQTNDGGYLILAEKRFSGSRVSEIYLLKTDKFGDFVKSVEVGDTLVNPVGKFTAIADRFYFFCMQTTTSTGTPAQVKLASINSNLDDLTVTSLFSEIEGYVPLTYPAVSASANNNFVLLSYNNDSKQSAISEIALNGEVTKTKGFTVGVGEGSEDAIINHYLKEGKQYPFEVGMTAPGIYFFNGFYEYSFSLVFTDINSDEPIGVVQGQQQNGGFSAITPTSTGKFAAARFNFGDNYLLPNPAISINTITSGIDLDGFSLPELIPDAKVKILRATIDAKNVLIYASDTQTRQIGLYFYDETTGEFLSSRYLGFSNPFEVSNIIQTTDGGLAVCGTTYLAGRFPRICLFKLSEGEVVGNVNL